MSYFSRFLMPLPLQLFAGEGGEGGGSGEGGGQGGGSGEGQGQGGAGNGNPSNNLDELLKDPTFKAAYESKLQDHLSQRMKKFKDVDPDEYKRLKEEEDKKRQETLTETQKLQEQIDKLNAQVAQVSVKEKEIAVKEFSIEKGMNPKLVARLIDTASIKKGENGWEGLEEAVTSLTTEFPELFPADGQGQGQGSSNQGGSTYKPPNQKGNNPNPKNAYEAGKARALARHTKQE